MIPSIRRSMTYFIPDRAAVLALLVVGALSTVLGLLETWPMAILVDHVLTDAPNTGVMHRLFLQFLSQSKVGQIIGLAVFYAVLRLLTYGANAIHSVLEYNIGQMAVSRARCELFRKLQHLGLPYSKENEQGDSVYNLNADVEGFHSIFSILVETVMAAINISIMLVIMFSCSATLTWLALAIVPFLIATNLVFAPQMELRTQRAKDADVRLNNSLIHALQSMPIVQAFSRSKEECLTFEGAAVGSAQGWQKVNRNESVYLLIIESFYAIGFALVIGVGGYLAYRGLFVTHAADTLTIGEILVFSAYLNELWTPLCRLTGFKMDMQQGLVGTKRLFEVFDRAPSVAEVENAKQLTPRLRQLSLADVSFSYDGGKEVLKRFSADIPAGSLIGIVGKSGSGKSTLLNLLPRLYDPSSGCVTLDGEDIRHCSLDHVRRHFAVAFQENILLPTTIYANIAYGRPTANREEVLDAAARAGIAEFIEGLPQQYDTPITEGASNLSGGERQRIAIARALLSDAPVLVLDEPTSAQDPEHEYLLTRTMCNLKGKRTVILVTHRLASVVNCDRIYVLKGGRLAEQGTHDELIAKRGVYWRMLQREGKQHDAA